MDLTNNIFIQYNRKKLNIICLACSCVVREARITKADQLKPINR